MKRSYNIKQAQANFERLIREAYAGDEVILMRGTTPIGKLVPIRANTGDKEPRSSGRISYRK